MSSLLEEKGETGVVRLFNQVTITGSVLLRAQWHDTNDCDDCLAMRQQGQLAINIVIPGSMLDRQGFRR